jgi:hypothetical protein
MSHAAVADHHGSRRIEPVLGEEVREEFALVLARAVELAAVHRDEVRVEREVLDDAPGVDMRLRSGHDRACAASPANAERLADAVVRGVLEEAHVGEAFA